MGELYTRKALMPIGVVPVDSEPSLGGDHCQTRQMSVNLITRLLLDTKRSIVPSALRFEFSHGLPPQPLLEASRGDVLAAAV